MERGLKRSQFVGVGLERSPLVIISILAIMKAGGCYVPLDPSMPAGRLDSMLLDSNASFVICLSGDSVQFSGRTQAILLDKEGFLIQQMGSDDLDLDTDPEDPCYMIYTSGSTGNPKGAINKHAALTNHFLWMQQEFGLDEGDCTLHKTPISFDGSLLEIFLPLQCGASIVIAKPDGHRDARYLLKLMEENPISFLVSVPSVFNIFLDDMDGPPRSRLKLVLLIGEEFTRKLYDKFKRTFPEAAAINLYGPAEAAITTLVYDSRRPFTGRSVPIGRPMANTQVYIVDESMRRVAKGENGELVIAGVQVGLGYHKRPELTREKFIDDPFDASNSYKAYRTGDVVCQLPDGQIEFRGRIDHQVKIFGVRIELGEIEKRLEGIEGVKRAVVVAKDFGGEKILVAYWSGADIEEAQVRKTLARDLPEAMVPALFRKVEDFPFNANGKIDRNALPDIERVSSTQDLFEAEDEIEATVVRIWSALLNSPVGRRTHFFEAGGNSLTAISLIGRLNEALELKLHPQHILENPRLADFLQIIRHPIP